MDGRINLYVCPSLSPYVHASVFVRASEWQAKSKNLYVCFDNQKRDKLKKSYALSLSFSVSVSIYSLHVTVYEVSPIAVLCIHMIYRWMCKHHSHMHTHTHNHSLVHAIILCFARFASFAFCVQSFPIVARLKRLCFYLFVAIWDRSWKTECFRYSSNSTSTKQYQGDFYFVVEVSNNGNGISSTLRRIYILTKHCRCFSRVFRNWITVTFLICIHTHTRWHTILEHFVQANKLPLILSELYQSQSTL